MAEQNQTSSSGVVTAGRSDGRLQLTHVRPFLSHVDSEEAALRAFCKVLHEMPGMVEEPEKQRLFRQRLEQAMAVSDRLTERRHVLLMQMGRLCGLAVEQVSISQLAQRADNQVVKVLLTCQSRLFRVIQQIQELSFVVGWIMNETRMLNSLILQEVLGDRTSDRYTSSGVRSVTPESIRFQARS